MVIDKSAILTENVGLVHQMPYASTRRGFSSHMEKVNIDTCRINQMMKKLINLPKISKLQ
jgi:hypothetical protein